MKAIYFIGFDEKGQNVSKANIQTDPKFSSSAPEILFYGNYSTAYTVGTGTFDIHPDGNRFLMQQSISDEGAASNEMEDNDIKLSLIINWPELIDE